LEGKEVMQAWLHVVDISSEYKKVDQGDISYKELATLLADKLESLGPFKIKHIQSDKDNIIQSLKSTEENLTPEKFDSMMEPLYDWGDTVLGRNKKVCLIKII
jgi:hypothetical protein